MAPSGAEVLTGHMPSPSCEITASMELGVPGYTFADLHDPERLASLYERFCEEVQAADPAFWAEWDAYRRAPDAPRPPVALSNLLVAMAPHVSRFVTRLFDVDAPAAAIAGADARAGRSVPLQGRLRPPPRAAAAEGRRARRRRRRKTTRSSKRLIAGASTDDRELADRARRLRAARSRKGVGDPQSAEPPQSANRGAEALVRRAPPRSAPIATG